MTVLKKKVAVQTEVKYVKYKETAANTVIALGEYLGHEMRPNFDPSKPDVPLFKVRQEDGTVIGLNSASYLNPLLLPLTTGTTVEVLFKGFVKKKSKTGLPYTVGEFEVFELQ